MTSSMKYLFVQSREWSQSRSARNNDVSTIADRPNAVRNLRNQQGPANTSVEYSKALGTDASVGHNLPMTGPLSIVIYRSINRDGETYALEPGSEEQLKEHLGDELRLRSRVFIAHEDSTAQEPRLEVVSQIAQLLTGLTLERLLTFGELFVHDTETGRDTKLPAA